MNLHLNPIRIEILVKVNKKNTNKFFKINIPHGSYTAAVTSTVSFTFLFGLFSTLIPLS